MSICGRQNVHALITGNDEYIMFRVGRDFANVINVLDFQIGRLFWIAWVGSTSSHEP